MAVLISNMTIEVFAIAFYLCAFCLQLAQVVRPASKTPTTKQSSPLQLAHPLTMAVAGAALLAHLAVSWNQLSTTQGIDFSLMPISVAILFVINLIVIVGSLRQPLHNLFLLLFPAAVALLSIAAFFQGDTQSGKVFTLGLGMHILLSVVAYSLMTIAALEAVFLAYQNRQLHQHHTSGLMRVLPPMQTMESLLFTLVATGFILLTLALATGFAFIEDFFAQHLAHKTVFSILAWVVYAILLWGRFQLGWRGKTATLWTLTGFFTLMLAFWGSKFVLEVVLPSA
jgi:ABC-type uncharacterized transport system permease subunit